MGRVAKTFAELDVYQLARDVQRRVFDLSKGFPREETYALASQIRRSSRSVGANLAEAWAKRRYPAHFSSKLCDAAGECNETWHWLDTVSELEYAGAEATDEIKDMAMHCGAMIEKMIDDAETWCRGRL